MTYEELLKLTEAGVEIWKPIVGYEGYYEISNLGRVKSLERWVKQGSSTRHVKESIKKTHVGAYGYTSVTLCKNKKSTDIPLHRLLAKTFIPNPENKAAIDHINTIKTDYSLKNLRWVTPKENANNQLTLQHCRENTYSEESLEKRWSTRKLGFTKTAPKTVYQYTKEGAFINVFLSIADAERLTGINRVSIGRVLDDTTQSAGGYLWTTILKDNICYNRRMPKSSKPILQYDKNNNFIREWASVSEASKSLGICTGNIIRNIRSTSIPRKYIFKYKESAV